MTDPNPMPRTAAEANQPAPQLSPEDGHRMIAALMRIKDPNQRERLIALAEAIAKD